MVQAKVARKDTNVGDECAAASSSPKMYIYYVAI